MKVTLTRVLVVLAVASLLGALLYARLAGGPDLVPLLARTLEAGESLGKESKGVHEVLGKDGSVAGYLTVATAPGYGGPLVTATRLDKEGEVVAVVPLSHKETPGFFTAVLQSGYLKQFQGLSAGSPFSLTEDLQGVSGATITSAALARAVRDGAHEAGRNIFGLSVSEPPALAGMGTKEWALIAMLALSALLFSRKWVKLRLPFLVLSVLVMGFWLGAMFAIPQLTALVMGYAPPLRESLHWYILVVGVVGLTVFFGHAWYCYWLCPFGGVQELLSYVGKGMVKPGPGLRKTLGWLRWAVLWAGAMVAFLTLSPGAGGVEPFSTLFLFKGSTLQWMLLLLVLVGAILVPRLWCNYLCPVGAFHTLIDWGRREVKALWRRTRNTKPAA
jgi:NosR/NirI family transcriptional regulator, nitrous oxide reductase regulator